jgi:hypothetical protein
VKQIEEKNSKSNIPNDYGEKRGRKINKLRDIRISDSFFLCK